MRLRVRRGSIPEKDAFGRSKEDVEFSLEIVSDRRVLNETIAFGMEGKSRFRDKFENVLGRTCLGCYRKKIAEANFWRD